MMTDVKISLIKRERLHKIRKAAEDLPHLLGLRGIDIKTGGSHDQVRAELQGLEGRHRRVAAEPAGLIVGSCEHSSLHSTHGHRFSVEGGIIPDLNGRIKAVHVDVQDLPHQALK